MERLVKYLASEAIRFSQIPIHGMKLLTREQFQSYISTIICHICGLEIADLADKFGDHCHYSGKYRGDHIGNVTWNTENLNFSQSQLILLSGYDMHLIIKHLASEFPEGNLRAISENTQRYTSIDVITGTYIDKSEEERLR